MEEELIRIDHSGKRPPFRSWSIREMQRSRQQSSIVAVTAALIYRVYVSCDLENV